MTRHTITTDELASEPSVGATARKVDLSIIVPVSERNDGLRDIFEQYSKVIRQTGKSYEFIFVLDGPQAGSLEGLADLRQPEIRVISLNRWFGEATALGVGFEAARAELLITIPSYFQVVPGEIEKMLGEYERSGVDLLIARRHPRIDSRFNRLQSWVFHRLTRSLTGMRYHDISCGIRVMSRTVAREINLYGDLHRFLPLLAYQRGFTVEEMPVRQSPRDRKTRVHRPGLYLRRLLDILTLFFVFKFTKKPLRFFGLVGSGVFGVGAVISLYLGIYRLMSLGPIANRPLLILGVLLIVLGIQLFSIGLLGEIIIFTHARGLKDYQIRELLDDQTE